MEQENWSEYEKPWAESTARYLVKQGIEPTEENIRNLWRKLAKEPQKRIII